MNTNTTADIARRIPVACTAGDMADILAAAHTLAENPSDVIALAHITTFSRRALQPALDALPYHVADELLRSGKFGGSVDANRKAEVRERTAAQPWDEEEAA